MAAGPIVALLGVLGVVCVGYALHLELWLVTSLAFVVYSAFRILFRDERPAKARPKAPASPGAAQQFGSPSGPTTPEDERLRRRVAAAKRLGNTPLSQQKPSR